MKKEFGRQALEKYAAAGNYLFHGSQNEELTVLEPRITSSKAERESGVVWVQKVPVISATANIDVAIFTATVWRRGQGTSGWYSHGAGAQATFTFNASRGVIAEVIKPESIGYVYVLPKAPFKPTAEIPAEFQSELAVTPVAIVQVHANDLRPDVRTLKPDPVKH